MILGMREPCWRRKEESKNPGSCNVRIRIKEAGVDGEVVIFEIVLICGEQLSALVPRRLHKLDRSTTIHPRIKEENKTATMSLSTPLRRACLPSSSIPQTQCRHATLIRRPKRPYTFTQLVTLSDGSTYTHRTTSPAPVYVSTKDTRNTLLWNPSSQKMLNIEADEAGKLRAFREKFGRGWDAARMEEKDEEDGMEGGAEGGREPEEKEDNLMDLISGYGLEAEAKGEAKGVRQEKEKSGKRKGGQR